ncbi:MAG: tetratricopeptide repeat protein [Candidatus Obscuribacterales bacterium]|nr:tetratricopeptide repeat protein [Candidatus Obscuribacterales bacterium]
MKKFQKCSAAILCLICVTTQVAEGKKKGNGADSARLKEIRYQVKAGKAQTVVYELESITRKDPKNVEAWLLLSKVYTDLDMSGGNMIGKAMEAAQKAVDAQPHNSTALKTLAELNAQRGHFKEALSLVDLAIAQPHQDPFAYKTKALILSEIKRDKEAVAAWDKFVSLNPFANSSLNQIDDGALIYARGGQTDKAIALYDKLNSITPSEKWILKKAETYAMGGRVNEAIGVYSELIRLHPGDELALMERAKLKSKQGKYKEALTDMDAAIKEMPTSSMYLERAGIYEKLGNAKMAQKDRQRARE